MMKKVMLLLLVTVMLVGFASAEGLWENNMSTDPDGDGWAVRGTANGYTMGGGVLTMNAGAWSTLLDNVPEDPFLGSTAIDMKWRATSGQSGAAGGIGLWFNAGVAEDATEYGYLRFSSGMNANADGQIFLLDDSTGTLATHAFGTGMLTMKVVIDQILNTVTYTVNDGSATFSDTLTYAASTAIGANTAGVATMYTNAPAGEIDYIKIANPATGGSGAGRAHSPVPTGTVLSDDVPSTTTVSWYSPEQDENGNPLVDPNTDPNLVSVDNFDVYLYDVLTADVTADDPNFVGVTPVDRDLNQFMTITPVYDHTYFWRVDTTVTWDSNEITGTASTQSVAQGLPWQFDTEPEYLDPTQTFDSVITTLNLSPAILEASRINGNDVTDVTFTLLTDDFEFPAGSDALLTDTTPVDDLENPTAALSTTFAGTYKVRLVTDDGTASLEDIAEVEVYADACQAKKDAPSVWTANYYDRDDDCDVDLGDYSVFAIEWLYSTAMDESEAYEGAADYVPADVFASRIEAEGVDPDDPNVSSVGPLSNDTDIRIEEQANASGGQALGYANATSWVEYTINVQTAGVPVDVYAGHANGTGTVTLSFGTEAVPDAYGTGTLDGTGNWTAFTDGRKIGEVTFTASGSQIVRTSYGGALNLDWFSFDW